MGSDRKSRETEKKKLKRTSPSSPRDEAKSKRVKRGDAEKKEKSNKKHKSHKSSKRRSDKEKKSGEKRKDKDHKHHDLSKLEIRELSNEDYFSKNNEFATWLREERKIFFSDLSSDSARDLFKEFVVEWNNKELEPRYYDGIAVAPRTSHKWNIKK
ncbi:Pentatricopeptide repeat-containing protein [Abeliophyllum distichum]|uniref:Pentatricopeptide repeat-containing protein n=1 Tax=Abeliophyllum distichum TaxID=126358 RepID=A0ABD1QI03_9LAMI